jgi:hypothetical protein
MGRSVATLASLSHTVVKDADGLLRQARRPRRRGAA